ncbi:MAG: membrane protein insertion efficiency factor YidD [Oscillospiraceae bacterium]|nr:membrane protein insertion efficiency factor YidD [Oscillospiraceae bacterium]
MKRVLIALVRFYRKHISSGTKPSCRFIPTCSAYAEEALEKHGAWRGSGLTLRRLSKCHPFNRQKSVEYDPVP